MFRKVYLLFGEEEYLVQQYKHSLIEAVVDPEDSMNLNIHRQDIPDFGQIRDEVRSMPFFKERRMVVLEDTGLFAKSRAKSGSDGSDAGEGEEEEENESSKDSGASASGDGAGMAALLSSLIAEIPDSTVLLFVERPDEKKAGGRKGKVSVDKRSRLYKAVAKEGLACEFEAQDAQSLTRWVAGRLAEEKIRITSGAMERFLQMTGSDMSHIDTETQKLISYALPGGVLHLNDIEALTSEILEGKVFRMIDLITRHEQAAALNLYYDLLQLRESPHMILALLMRQFDRMMLAKDVMNRGGGTGQIMSELKLADWQARQLMNQAKFYSTDRIRALTQECVRMQQLVQSGLMEEISSVTVFKL